MICRENMAVDTLLRRLKERGIPVEEIVVGDTPEAIARHEEVEKFIKKLYRMHKETGRIPEGKGPKYAYRLN